MLELCLRPASLQRLHVCNAQLSCSHARPHSIALNPHCGHPGFFLPMNAQIASSPNSNSDTFCNAQLTLRPRPAPQPPRRATPCTPRVSFPHEYNACCARLHRLNLWLCAGGFAPAPGPTAAPQINIVYIQQAGNARLTPSTTDPNSGVMSMNNALDTTLFDQVCVLRCPSSFFRALQCFHLHFCFLCGSRHRPGP